MGIPGLPEQAAMAAGTDLFAANPIGVVFDPKRLIARYEAGETIDELTSRQPLPEGTTPLDMLRF